MELIELDYDTYIGVIHVYEDVGLNWIGTVVITWKWENGKPTNPKVAQVTNPYNYLRKVIAEEFPTRVVFSAQFSNGKEVKYAPIHIDALMELFKNLTPFQETRPKFRR